MDQTPVVYYYADPAYKGDMTAALAELTDLGYRVVKGDNADELLFLLQVGRPAAVIYTLSAEDSITSAAFQMVSRRAFDLLVPIVAVGPADPRDGVTLVYPEGRKAAKRHIPFHSMAALISEYDERPPSTPSRPPDKIKGKTMGKGRTLLSWKPPPSVVEQPPPSEPPRSVPPKRPASDKRTLQMSAAAAEELAEERIKEKKAGGSARVTRDERDKRTLEMSAAAAAKKTTPEIPHRLSSPGPDADEQAPDPVADSGARPRLIVESSREIEEPSIGALMREADAEATARTKAERRRKKTIWRVAGPLLALAAIGAVVVVIYLATQPAAPPPQPLRHGEVTEGPPRPEPQAQAEVPPKPEPQAEVPPKPLAEADTAQPDQVTPTEEEVAAASPITVGELIPGVTTRFPAHFRPGTATFWYSEEAVEQEFLAKVEALGSAHTFHIIGHPTAEEARAKNWAVGLSRAWAVEKYLVRHGVDPERIETSRGVPVEPRDDQDYRGWLRNRWVDIEVK
jgi:outer membrane protein OmpA-like peptidoglycan-associated protein